MKINTINKNNKYLVNISFDDRPSLSSLIYFYAPIIGNEATFFYQLLFKESQNVFINNIYILQERLLTLLNISEDKLLQLVSKLEFVGLLTLYVNPATKDRITFVLNRPLSVNNFMKHESLSKILKIKINEQNILINQKPYLINKFKKNEQDILLTKEFQISPKNDVPFDKLNITFDLSTIFELLEQEKIDYTNWDKEMETVIADSVLIYDLSIMEIINIIVAMKKLSLKINPRSFKQYVEEKKKPNLNKISKIFDFKDITTETKLELIKKFQPIELIELLFERKPYQEEIDLIKDLKSKYKFNNSLINLLLDHSKLVNDAIIKNYVKKIATTLIKNKIDNFEQAKLHLKTAYKISNRKFSKKKQTEIAELDFE